MRSFESMVIVTLVAASFWLGWSGNTARAVEPGACEACDTCGVQGVQQEPNACDDPPTILSTLCGRFFNPNECEPHWSFSADAVALQRSNTRSQVLFRPLDSREDFVNSSHLNFPAAMGFQLGAVRHGPCGWDVELGYFQMDGWAANATTFEESLMVTRADNSGYLVESGATARYTSGLHLAEINLKREWLEGLTLLAGFRMGELNELYSANGIGANDPVAISLNTKTFNHLYGFQLGADYEFYNMGGPLRINALCKSGIYGNYAMQSTREIETGVSDNSVEVSRNQATFMGEAGAVATYDVTKHFALRASFQAVWIEGVALAPEQIGATNFTQGVSTIDTHGGVFYYGGGLGAEVKF